MYVTAKAAGEAQGATTRYAGGAIVPGPAFPRAARSARPAGVSNIILAAHRLRRKEVMPDD